ncbi:uncharacterized protein DUF3293 [Luteimonas sp. J16]|uniref:DUF3293 domain-containing protein n=1 Tax=unclassified Luteimonas TaxID=2629088 RepID=UPI0004B712BB|nr:MULTISPECIES: DUF3293 domain-containing protein [unclassified Luteimonas]TWG90132.1 uncharacterized protein DUF3293 [Luteimonas sp. J16]
MENADHRFDGARVAALLEAYLRAEYQWQHGGSWHDIVVGLPAPGLELAYPDATSFGMLSAWNPQSIERSSEENRHADDALHDALLASGRRFLPAFAQAPNRTWREPSWLVMDMDAPEFDALARRFGQLGSLWWRPGQRVRLRMDAARPDEHPDDANVDWLQ